MSTDLDLLIGRALLAAAWADGQLDDAERDALEDLLLEIDDLAPDTWRALHADLDRPFDPDHRRRVFAELDEALTHPAQRQRAAGFVRQMKRRLPPRSEEAQILAGLAESLATGETATPHRPEGLFARLGTVLSGGLALHSQRVQQDRQAGTLWESSLRERLAQHWPADEDWPAEDDLHRVCIGAAILAHVARLDGRVARGELDALNRALVEQWGLGPSAARLATELVLDETAGGVDLHLLLREFQRCTSEEERQRFLAAVFTVAAGDGTATYDEIEEVRRIGRGLLLSHQHFIAAKLQVPADHRET